MNRFGLSPCVLVLVLQTAGVRPTSAGTTEDLVAVDMRYVLNHPQIACVIPGFRNTRQVPCNLGAADRRLSDEDVMFIEKSLK